MSHWPWSVLGIARTDDKSAIRRAYAERLKAMDIDKDIQGFADLRHARDSALREADYAAQDDDGPLLADDEDRAAANFGEDTAIDDGAGPVADDEPFDDFAISWDDIHGDLGGGGDNPFGYGSGGYVPGAPEPDEPAQDGPDRVLAGLLFPGGEYSDQPFTLAENDEAQAALTTMLEDARSGDLGREQSLDTWLGEVLAESWPRSAPLLERTSTSFDWLAQSGEIGERPALQFLNPRLRGMRFTDKVEQPGHPLHKAWVELRRPGARSLFDRFRIKREEAMTLLGGIRQRYPEVEAYLDAERVASWEKPAPEWVGWLVQRAIILLIVAQALRFCAQGIPDSSIDPVTPDIVVTQEAQGIAANAYVREMFGEDATVSRLASAEPVLAGRIANLASRALYPGDEDAIREGAYVVRFLTHRAVQRAPFEDLLEIHALRRDAARAVKSAKGDAACVEFLRSARLPEGFVLSDDVRVRERNLGWKLVKAGLMDPDAEFDGPKSAPVPGWVFDYALSRSGATEAEVEAELAGKEGARSCAVRIALIEAMLARPGEVPADLLRLR